MLKQKKTQKNTVSQSPEKQMPRCDQMCKRFIRGVYWLSTALKQTTPKFSSLK